MRLGKEVGPDLTELESLGEGALNFIRATRSN